MKKVFFMVFSAAAITFASCGNKTGNAPEVDTTAVDSVEAVAEEANAAADEAISNLTTLLDGKDANALQSAIEAIKAKAAELLAKNPEVAKEYLTKVQDFLKENSDKVKTLVGNNAAVGAAVSALTSASADDVISGLSSAIGDVKSAGADAVEGAANAADAVKNAAAEKVNDAKVEKEKTQNTKLDNKDAKKNKNEKYKGLRDSVGQGRFLKRERNCNFVVIWT